MSDNPLDLPPLENSGDLVAKAKQKTNNIESEKSRVEIGQNDSSILSFVTTTFVKNEPVINSMFKGSSEKITEKKPETKIETKIETKTGTKIETKPGVTGITKIEEPINKNTNITEEKNIKIETKEQKSDNLNKEEIKPKEPKREPFDYNTKEIENFKLSDDSSIDRNFSGEGSGIFDNIFGGNERSDGGGGVIGGKSKPDEGDTDGFFTSFTETVLNRDREESKSTKKTPQKPSNDPNLKDPKISIIPLDDLTAGIQSTVFIDPKINRYILSQSSKSRFRKSYSIYTQLTPFIKCYIKTGDDSSSKKFDVNLFDIPYNMIKSLEVNYESGSAVSGTINLKFEDATGSVGIFLMSKLYSLGLTSYSSTGVPKIIIQFGWSPNGRQKIKKTKNSLPIYTSNYFTEYLIQSFDVDYSQNFKLEITLKAQQEKTSVDGIMQNKHSGFTPHEILSEYPLQILRAKEYAFYFKSHPPNADSLKKFGFLKPQEVNDIKKVINNFLGSNGYRTVNPPASFNLIPQNPIFNCFNVNKIDSDNSIFIENFKRFIDNSKFTPYFVLQYFLNQYIETIKKIKDEIPRKITDNTPEIKIRVIDLYDKTQIDRYGLDGKTPIVATTYKELVSNDIKAGKDKKGNTSNKLLSAKEFKISDSETWEALLDRIAKMIHYTKNSSIHLNFSVNYLTSSVPERAKQFKDNEIFLGSAELNNLKSHENLIQRLKQLKEAYKKISNQETKEKVPNNKRSTEENVGNIKSLDKTIQNIDEMISTYEKDFKDGYDYILIIISAGSNFTIPSTLKESLVVQKYTVFPKIKPSFDLKYQNFNSGSKKMIDESYPDVIDFKPKIDFKRILAHHFARFDVVNFKNGLVEVKTESDIKIKDSNLSPSQITSKIKNLVKNSFEVFISTPTNTNPPVTLDFKITGGNTGDGASYYTLDNIIIFKSALFPGGEIFFKSSNADHKIIIKEVYEKLIKLLGEIRSNTIYSSQNNLFRKSIKVTPGYNQIVDYQSYEILANEYMTELQASSYDFEAELTILGEPGFTFDYGLSLNHIFLEVNNPNGQKNRFLTGRYYVMKMKHTIESGKFLTTLSLKFDSPMELRQSTTNYNTDDGE